MSTTGISGTPNVPSILSNLNLSQTQQQQIGQIVQSEQNGSISFQQAKTQVEGVLTPQQQSQLRSEHHGGHHRHSKQSGTQAISDVAASFFAQTQSTTATGDPAASYFGQPQDTNSDGPA